MPPQIPIDHAAQLIRDGRAHYSCCGVPLGIEHIPECVHFQAVRPMSQQCPSCTMIGFHHADCSDRTEVTPENPRHYDHPSGIETIRVNRCMTFAAGSAFKYMLRYESKANPPEDLRKARWYVADMDRYQDRIWIDHEHKELGRPLLEQMAEVETNPYRRRFFEAILELDVDAMADAIEDARETVAGEYR